jgi:hypothetical protein
VQHPALTSSVFIAVRQALGPFRLAFPDLRTWWFDLEENNAELVRVTNFESDDGSAPVQVIVIGPADIGRRQGDAFVEVAAGAHGDEELTVDSARAIAVSAIGIADQLEEKRVAFVITGLVGGIDYILNESRFGARTLGEYAAGFSRFAQDNLEGIFDDPTTPLPIRVAKHTMNTFLPETRISLHNSMVTPVYSLASARHGEIARHQQALATQYKLPCGMTNRQIDVGVPEIAPGVFAEHDEPRFRTSNGYLAKQYDRSLRTTTESPTWLINPRIDSSLLTDIRRRATTTLTDAVDRLQRTSNILKSPLDQFVLRAANKRGPERVGIRNAEPDTQIENDGDVERLIFLLRDLGLAGRALGLLGDTSVSDECQELVKPLDDARTISPVEPMASVAVHLGYAAFVVEMQHGLDMYAGLRPKLSLQ